MSVHDGGVSLDAFDPFGDGGAIVVRGGRAGAWIGIGAGGVNIEPRIDSLGPEIAANRSPHLPAVFFYCEVPGAGVGAGLY